MKSITLHVISLTLLLPWVSFAQMQHQYPKELPALKISENKRYLVEENDKPFFWLGNTGWLLFSKLTREEADKYLTDRAEEGFNIIQAMVLHTVSAINVYGDSGLIEQYVLVGASTLRAG